MMLVNSFPAGPLAFERFGRILPLSVSVSWLIHRKTFIAPLRDELLRGVISTSITPRLASHPSLAVRPWRVDRVKISFTVRKCGLTDNHLWGIVVPLIANVQPKYEGWS
jgi:hypothetical protein